jgi:hypothetical protein
MQVFKIRRATEAIADSGKYKVHPGTSNNKTEQTYIAVMLQTQI